MRLISLLLLLHALVQAAFTQPIILFPGDANNDGVANHFDLLPIGVAYGMEGFPRQNASLNWQPQTLFPPWPDALPVSEINKGFVDCDGDGFIDTFDIEAIVFNFDSTQHFSVPPPMPYPPKLTDTCFTCPKPDIVISFDQDTLISEEGDFDTLYAYILIRYPPNVPPQNGALGIAFDVEYDYNPDNIKDGQTTVYPDTFPNNRMYVIATSTKAQLWRLPPPGRIGFAGAGRGQNVFFTPDTLFVAKFIITDMIIRGAENFSLKISNILILNNLEQVVCMGNTKQIPVVIVSGPEPRRPQPVVYLAPNPVRDILTVESPGSPLEKIDVRDPNGRLVLTTSVQEATCFELPVGCLPAGVWLATVQTQGGAVVKKFIKPE